MRSASAWALFDSEHSVLAEEEEQRESVEREAGAVQDTQAAKAPSVEQARLAVVATVYSC